MVKALIEVDTVVWRDGQKFPVRGFYDAAEDDALKAFMKAFSDDEETGAAVSVVRDGETVIDLWGGYMDAARTAEWSSETTVCMMSVAKGFAVTCLHMLADRGLIDYDTPASTYWPAFAQSGKKSVPVRYLLDHLALTQATTC
jgi:CubicO group peptidase (beta-lactamase class C family)